MDSPQLGGVFDPSRNASFTGQVESTKTIKSIGAAGIGGVGYGTGAGRSGTHLTNPTPTPNHQTPPRPGRRRPPP